MPEPATIDAPRTSSHLKVGIVAGIVVIIALAAYACGPTAYCLADGGDPVSNAFGAKWCDVDQDGRLSEPDYGLSWW